MFGATAAVFALPRVQAVRDPRKIARSREGNSADQARNPLRIRVPRGFDISGPTLEEFYSHAGMWEFPEITGSNGTAPAWLTLRHSITVTDFRVSVVRDLPPAAWTDIGCGSPSCNLPLTGLARKSCAQPGHLILQRSCIASCKPMKF